MSIRKWLTVTSKSEGEDNDFDLETYCDQFSSQYFEFQLQKDKKIQIQKIPNKFQGTTSK
jgi:hypothetical protein